MADGESDVDTPFKLSYFNDKGEPIVVDSICCFADLLGFSHKVLTCNSAKDSNVLLQACSKLISDAKARIKARKSEYTPLEVEAFSDSLVLALPVYGTWPALLEPELWRTIDLISLVQLELCLGGFPMRGALTGGEMHMSNHMCFGKALVDAAVLEKKAENPRIILDSALSELVQHHLTFYGEGAGNLPHLRTVLVDFDGRYFVNYLSQTDWNEFGSDLDMLTVHANLVHENLKTHAGNARVLQKYEWMARYHNFFVENCLYFTEEFPGDGREETLWIEGYDMGDIRFLNSSDAKRISPSE